MSIRKEKKWLIGINFDMASKLMLGVSKQENLMILSYRGKCTYNKLKKWKLLVANQKYYRGKIKLLNIRMHHLKYKFTGWAY